MTAAMSPPDPFPGSAEDEQLLESILADLAADPGAALDLVGSGAAELQPQEEQELLEFLTPCEDDGPRTTAAAPSKDSAATLPFDAKELLDLLDATAPPAAPPPENVVIIDDEEIPLLDTSTMQPFVGVEAPPAQAASSEGSPTSADGVEEEEQQQPKGRPPCKVCGRPAGKCLFYGGLTCYSCRDAAGVKRRRLRRMYTILSFLEVILYTTYMDMVVVE